MLRHGSAERCTCRLALLCNPAPLMGAAGEKPGSVLACSGSAEGPRQQANGLLLARYAVHLACANGSLPPKRALGNCFGLDAAAMRFRIVPT